MQNIFNESEPAFIACYYCIIFHSAVILQKMYKITDVQNSQKSMFNEEKKERKMSVKYRPLFNGIPENVCLMTPLYMSAS